MMEVAARTTKDARVPSPCSLHIVAIASGRELFESATFDAMNRTLARGVLGDDQLDNCRLEIHELGRDGADRLFTRVRSQGRNVLILEATYIPISKGVVAYIKLRDGTGRVIGESGRYDLPVARTDFTPTGPAEIEAAAEPVPLPIPKPDQAVNTAAALDVQTTAAVKPAPKLATKLLTEVHFDPSSAQVTVVGKRKIKEAIEAIKKQNPRKIRILGFTDTKGDATANKAMAAARANNVARFLEEAGIDLPLEVEGRGEEGGPYKIPDGELEPLNRCVGIIAVDVPVAQ